MSGDTRVSNPALLFDAGASAVNAAQVTSYRHSANAASIEDLYREVDCMPALTTLFRSHAVQFTNVDNEISRPYRLVDLTATQVDARPFMEYFIASGAVTPNRFLLATIREQLAVYTSYALAEGDLPISQSAVNALESWFRDFHENLIAESTISIEATGMSDGGAVAILFHNLTDRQFTLRISSDGNFFMASGVYRNLRSILFSEAEASLASALKWLKS